MNNFKMCIILLFATLTSIISSANASYNTSISYNNTLIRNKRGFGGMKTIYEPYGMSAMKSTLAAALYLVMCADNYLQVQVKEEKYCVINVKVLKTEHALIINPKDRSRFLYPDDKGNIYFKEGDPVFLSCAQEEENYFDLMPGKPYGTFFCVCGVTFTNTFRLFDFNELTCNSHPKHSHKLVEDDSHHQKIEIGFIVRPGDFLTVYELMYWKDRKLAEYAKYTVSKSLLGGQNTDVKIPLPPGVCCRILPTILQALNEDDQLESFKELIACQSQQPERCYFKKDDCHIFGRDRLASRDANVYTAAALATYNFTNIMPMFKCVAKNNWLRIDKHINKMATTLKMDLTVYAGVLNTLAVRDPASRTDKDMYLSVFGGGSTKSYPIPLYFYKVVVNWLERKGVVFVTVNDLFIGDRSVKSYHICKNPIIEMTGVKMPLGWQPKNYAAGYSYMCTVDDFQTFNHLFFEDNIKELLYIPKEEVATSDKHWIIRDDFKRSIIGGSYGML